MRYVLFGLLFTSVVIAHAAAGREAAAAPSVSDADDIATSTPMQTLRKISVSATRGPEELTDIPNTVTVLDSEEIEHQLARDIKDLIRYEPGVSVSNASTRFGLAGFNIRGIEANRVAMRIDGVRMSDAFDIGSFSDARRNLVDLSTLKAVEIVRGPASALYGSDAIGGVVSFVTKDPADFLDRDKPAYLGVRSGYRDDNSGWDVGATLAGGSEKFGALLVYGHSNAKQTDNQGSVASRDNTRTEPNPQDHESQSVLGKLTWNPNETHALRLTVAYDHEESLTEVLSSQGRGAGAFASIFTVGLEGDDTQDRTRIVLDHTIETNAAAFDQFEWRVYAQETTVEQKSLEERYSFSAGPASTLFRDRLFSFDQSTIGSEVLARKQVSLGSTEHLFTYGVDLLTTETEQMRNGLQTTQATGAVSANILPDNFPVRDFPKTSTDQYALYVQDQITLADGALQLIPGVRVDYYQLDPQSDDVFSGDNPGVTVVGLEETSVSPKLGAIWYFTDTLSTYANYARGFRAPPYNDVNIGFTNLAFGYTAIANPDLKPETSNGYEFGLRGERDRGFFSLAAFYNDYDDFIASLNFVGVQDGLQVFQSQNLSQAHIYGAELRGGFNMFENRIRIRSSIAYARGSGRTTGEEADRPINSVDPLKGVVGIAYQPRAAWSVELIGTAVDRHKHADQTSPQFVPSGYFLLDLLAQAEFGANTRFSLGVFNLTDKQYWDWSDVRGLSPTSLVLDRYSRPGINFGASVTLQF